MSGLWRPCILLPEGLSAALSAAELETVLAHELAHVRRRDNFTALFTHIIVAAFWFHPLLWWIERRMLRERETACDEMVLANGASADVYAAAILRVCRRSLSLSGAYAAFTGLNLTRRMEHIMSTDSRSSRSILSRVALCAIIAWTLLAPIGTGFLAAQPRPLSATPPQAAPQQEPSTRTIMIQVEDLLKQNKPDEALVLLQNEIERGPNRTDLQMALGNVAVRASRYDLAIATFKKVLDSMGQDPKAAGDLYSRIGEANRRKGDMGLAIENLRRAKELAPDSTVIPSTLALTLDSAGQTAAAQREYESVLTLDPDNYVALNNLAFLLAHGAGTLDRAFELAQRAWSSQPEGGDVLDTIGWIQLKRNDPGKAIAAFNKALQAKPSDPTYHYHLAMAFTQKGDNAQAIRELRTALSLDPSPKIAKTSANF